MSILLFISYPLPPLTVNFFYAGSGGKKSVFFTLCGRKVLFRAKATESLSVTFQYCFIPHALKQTKRNDIYVKLTIRLLSGDGGFF